MFKFGLIKSDGIFNTTSTDIYYKNYFKGYKPVQSIDIFGLINSTDGNFWLISEDDDHYWTTAKISEKTIRDLHTKLKDNDLSDENIFQIKNDLITMTVINLENNKPYKHLFHKDWLNSLLKTLDIDNPIKTEKEILPIWEKIIVPDKINYPLMTPEECIYERILAFPTLYATSDFELTKFKVIDKLFNTLGGGYSRIDELIDVLSKRKEIDVDRAKRLCKETFFDGFGKTEEMDLGTRKLIRPNIETCIAKNIFKEEKENYKDVIFWTETNPNKTKVDIILERFGLKKETKYNPYPNFDKEYSILWKNQEILNKLSPEWKKELIWFYENCLIAINKGCYKDYSEFPTGSKKADDKRIEEMKRYIGDKTNKEVTKQYELEYNGNIEDFLTRKWLKTKEKYENFIKETIELLKK